MSILRAWAEVKGKLVLWMHRLLDLVPQGDVVKWRYLPAIEANPGQALRLHHIVGAVADEVRDSSFD